MLVSTVWLLLLHVFSTSLFSSAPEMENYNKKGTAAAVPFTLIVERYGLHAKFCGGESAVNVVVSG
jgi:hypothetical protein